MGQSGNTENSGNLAIVTGRGLLPREIVAGMHNKGANPVLIGIDGEKESWLDEHKHRVFVWGQLGAFFRHLKQNNVKTVMFAGSMTRPKLRLRDMDFGALMTLPRVMSFMIGGDNSLLGGLINLFDSKGIRVVGAHEVMPELLAPLGQIVGPKPSKTAMQNIHKAFEACKKLGELDIGQAAIAVGGRVVAVEGIEGTDGMLERVADMRASGRLFEQGKHGVLVKTLKPNQDMRADLPTIGPKTIEMLNKAGLKGVALEAGHSLILAKSDTLEAAKKAGIFIFGLETKPPQLSP